MFLIVIFFKCDLDFSCLGNVKPFLLPSCGQMWRGGLGQVWADSWEPVTQLYSSWHWKTHISPPPPFLFLIKIPQPATFPAVAHPNLESTEHLGGCLLIVIPHCSPQLLSHPDPGGVSRTGQVFFFSFWCFLNNFSFYFETVLHCIQDNPPVLLGL